MIIQTLTFGTLNLAPYCRKNSLEVKPVRISGRSWTDIQGHNHVTTIGYTYEVTADLNPMSYEEAQAFFAAMQAGPQALTVSFAGNGQTGTISQSSLMDVVGFKPTFSPKYVQATGSLKFMEAY